MTESLRATRREFLKIVLGTVSSAAVANPVLACLLPEEMLERPVDCAWALRVDDSGFLLDDEFEPSLPTYYDALWSELDLDGLGPDEVQERICRWLHGGDADAVADCSGSEHEADDLIEPQFFSDYQMSRYTEYGGGVRLYEDLGAELCERLGLVLVESEQPGGSFTGVRALRPFELQADALREGLNVTVAVD